MDWADELAKTAKHSGQLATILRNVWRDGKAAGLREAADIIIELETSNRANRIERGEDA